MENILVFKNTQKKLSTSYRTILEPVYNTIGLLVDVKNPKISPSTVWASLLKNTVWSSMGNFSVSVALGVSLIKVCRLRYLSDDRKAFTERILGTRGIDRSRPRFKRWIGSRCFLYLDALNWKAHFFLEMTGSWSYMRNLIFKDCSGTKKLIVNSITFDSSLYF